MICLCCPVIWPSHKCNCENGLKHAGFERNLREKGLAKGARRHQAADHTMRFGSTAKVLLKCKLKYYRISECDHHVQA